MRCARFMILFPACSCEPPFLLFFTRGVVVIDTRGLALLNMVRFRHIHSRMIEMLIGFFTWRFSISGFLFVMPLEFIPGLR